MATIYIVTSGDYSAYHIDAVCSTSDLAQAYIDEREKVDHGFSDWARMEEWELDAHTKLVERTYWVAWLDLNTGNIEMQQAACMEHPNARAREPLQGDMLIRCESYVSAEHARKLAVEAYQAHLRKAVV